MQIFTIAVCDDDYHGSVKRFFDKEFASRHEAQKWCLENSSRPETYIVWS